MTQKTRQIIKYVLMGLMAFAVSVSLAQLSGYGITGIELMIPCVFALAFIVYNRTSKLFWGDHSERTRKDLRFAIPLGAVMALGSVIGSKIDLDERVFSSIGAVDLIYMIFLIPFFTSILLLLFFSLGAVTLTGTAQKDEAFSKSKIIKKCSCYMAVMLICWLPYFLTYFPGGIGNDDFESISMCLGLIPWTNHHPVFFTALMNVFIKLFGNSSLTAALGIMTCCQMILLALVLSLVLVWLEKRNVLKGFIYTSFAFFCVHPIVAMYAIYLTKDVPFAMSVILLVLCLYDTCTSNKPRYIALAVLSFLVIITRNNGAFMVGAMVILLLVFLKEHRKQLLITFLIVFAINALYKNVLWPAVGIEKQSFVESASIPLTQIAYTIYTDGTIEPEYRDYLESIMPFDEVKKDFLPGYVDTYKFDDSFDAGVIDADPMRFINTWWKLLGKNFSRYVEAYLFETCGYWHYGITNTVATEGVQPNTLGITGIDVFDSVTGHSLRGILEELVLIARKLPLLCMMSQMAIEFLAVILLIIRYLRSGQKNMICTMIPFVALWVSIMLATPAYCLFRYMCPVFFVWPVLIAEFFANTRKE